MARPIAETPTLYGEDAIRFEIAMRDVKPVPKERREEMLRNYEEVRKRCTFLKV